MFLRLRKAVRKHGLRVIAVAPFATRGLTKMAGSLMGAPGGEADALDASPPTTQLSCPARSSWSASGWPPRPVRSRPRPIGRHDRRPVGVGPAARR